MSQSSLKLRVLKQQQELSEQETALKIPSVSEQWALMVTTLIFTAGLFADGWAHLHVPSLESFFTPWHAVFYSGYLLTAGLILWIVARNARRLQTTFLRAAPLGYEYALIGIPLFLIGGIGDLLWHEIFGIEADIEALLSPTHLILAVSMFLMISANTVVWFQETPPLGRPKLLRQTPMLISVALSVSVVWFMTQFSHFSTLRTGDMATSEVSVLALQNIAITGYLLHSSIVLGFLFLLIRRGRLAFGAVTIILCVPMLAMSAMRDGMSLLPAIILTGIAGDFLAQHVYPIEMHRREFRRLSILLPGLLFSGYFLTAFLRGELSWTPELWIGSIVMSALGGYLLSFLSLPPREKNS